MRCAVSFLTVIVISIAVGVMALLIIWFTDSEDYCTLDKTFRCLDNGRCLKPTQSCNNYTDCDDGSDEAISYCRDFETLPTLIEIMTGGGKGVEGLNITDKPEICEYITRYDLPRGIKCHGRRMNETWDTIPWHEFDLQAKVISVDNGAINTSKLKETPDVHLNFSNLLRVYIENNTIGSIQDNVFCHMEAPIVKWLVMSNNSIVDLSSGSFACMGNTRLLKLAKNKLHLRGFNFKDLPILKLIDLDENEIGEITENTFRSVESLVVLQLSRNRIKSIHKDAFVHNINLKQLDLSHNLLHTIAPSLLDQNIKLEKLNITRNADIRLPYYLFRTLANLKTIDIESLDLTQFNASSFIDFTPNLDIVHFKRFTYCRLIPRVRRCFPYSDGLSSNSNLLVGQSRVAVWLVGLLTIFGNISVLADRLRRRPAGRAEMTEILNIFVTNLAAADLLMGIYLLSLAFKDVQYRGTYSVNAYKWGTSLLCSTIGIIGVISSEVSLLILTIMSLERYLSIGTLSQSQNLNINLARASMLIIWIFASILAIAPAIQWQGGYAPFYGTTGLCFPIHLDDRYPTGWQYTTFVFIGVNSCCLVLITVSYSLLYWTVRNTQNKTPLLKKNIELAARFFLMVFTDVLCWAPIIILKGFVLGGSELSNEIVSCAVIYLLPLNSAVNPILYTFSTKEKRAMIKTYITDFLDNLEMSRMAPSPPNNENSMELHCMTRSIFGGSRSSRLRKDQEHPNTGGTEDTELTHSACPTVSAPESRSWYSS